MANITSFQSGDFNVGSTWVGGVAPISGVDSFTITAGHIVAINMDSSGGSGYLASSVNGVLTAKVTAGTYYLKMQGNLTINSGGGYLIGLSISPQPVNAPVTTAFTGNFSITGAGTIAFYGTALTLYETTCSNAENAGSTAIEVPIDPTSWANGSLIRISDMTGTLPDSELRTILSTSNSPNTINITAGLTNAKAAGAIIHILTRNIKILGNGTTGSGISGNNSGFVLWDVELRDSNIAGITLCSSFTVKNCSFDNTSGIGVNGGTGAVVDHCFFRNNTPLTSLGGVLLKDSLIIGGVNSIISAINVNALRTRVLGGTLGLNVSSGVFMDCTFQNTTDLATVQNGRFYNCLFNGVTRWGNYNGAAMQSWNYTESFDDQQIAGDFKSHTRGGITSKNAATLTTPRGTKSYQTALESATYPAFWQQAVTVEGGQRLSFTAWLRKSATMTIRPRVQVFLAENDPLITGALPLSENIMTDSVDTWESFTVSLANTATYSKEYVIRFQGQHSTGTMDSDLLLQRDIVSTQEFEMELRVGDPISFTAFYQDAVTLLGKTGLTPTIDVYRDTTHIIDDAISSEIGDGFYKYDLSNTLTNQAGTYRAVFKTMIEGVIIKSITDRAQLVSWLNQFSAIGIQSATALKANGKTLELERGDDYLDSDGWAITWPPLTGITSLIGASGSFRISGFTAALTILSADTVRLELTSAQTRDLPIGEFIYELEFILANGHIISPLKGTLIVRYDL